MGLFDQSQGLMGLGQQPQGYNPYATNRGLPDPRNPNYMGQQGATGMSDDLQGAMGLPMFDRGFAPYNPQNTLGQQPNPATQEVSNYEMPMGDDKNIFVQNDRPMNYQQPQGMRTNVSSPTDALDRGYMNLINQRSQAGLSYPSAEEYRNTNIDAYRNAESQLQETTPALRPTPQPPQIFQPQPMQPSNPVNTQTVQPNFLGQTPFGQPQTSQYSSSNPFVQAAQANAQGNLAGALQATAANRVNQQTPFGGLQYQQTGTDAQGNPIWSANQTVAQPYQNAINSLSGQIQQNFAQPFDTSQYQNQMVGSTPQFQGVGQAPNLQTSVQGTGMQGWDQATNLLMSRLNPQIKQQNEASDAQLANQGIMPGSEAYNRAKTQIAQQQNDLLNQAQLAGSQIQNQMFNQNLAAGTFGNTALGNQNTMNLGNTAFNNALGQQGFANQLSGTAANNAARQANFGQGLTQYQLPTASLGSLRAATTPGYVNPYNQAAVAGPDYLSAYTSQNATDIARQNAEAAQRSSLLNTLGGLGSSAILGGTGANSALGGLLGLGSQGLTALGNSSLYNSLFGTGPAITGDKSYLDSIGLGGSTYGSGIGGMTSDPLADLYTNGLSPEQNLSDLFNSSFGFGY